MSDESGNIVPFQLPSIQFCEIKLFVVAAVPVLYVVIVVVSPGLGVSICTVMLSALLGTETNSATRIVNNLTFIYFL